MKKKPVISLLLLLGSYVSNAQETSVIPEKAVSIIPGIVSDPMNYIILFTIVILLATVLVMTRVISLLTWQLAGKPLKPESKSKSKGTVSAKKETFWSKMNDSIPIEKEADVLLDHDYDGIKELDNNLPPWWKYGFYMTIVFAFIYMIHYHVIGAGTVQLDEYNEQLAEADLQKQARLKLAANNIDENSVTELIAEADITAGHKIFTEKCAVCHGGAGEGNVGPNFTDDFWIHGGNIKDVFKTVKYGVPSKGMIAWQGQLNPVQMQQVSSYIKTLKGTNPPNPKAPQGTLYVEGGSNTTTDSTVTASGSTAVSIGDSTSNK